MLSDRMRERAAEALLAAIAAELPEVEAFAREDLLHLRCFQHVSMITRYQYVREAVAELVVRGALVARGRRELATPAMARAHTEAVLVGLGARYERVVARHAARQRGVFGVMDIVAAWKTDPHLTTNSKRIAAREALGRMVRAGTLERVEFGFRRPEHG